MMYPIHFDLKRLVMDVLWWVLAKFILAVVAVACVGYCLVLLIWKVLIG